jgi:hypothetical protein
MNIQSQRGGRCVDRAISTIKAAMGLPSHTELPETEKRNTAWVARQFANEFPDRQVRVWLEEPVELPENAVYEGDNFYGMDRDEDWMVAFAYGDPEGDSHMVVGLPGLGYEVKYTIIVAVSLERNAKGEADVSV